MEEACIIAWRKAKEIIADEIVLWHIDPNKEFYIFVDSSDTASGSVILQYKGTDLRPVAFHSKVFTRAERNYNASEREMLGVLHALQKYRYILMGKGPRIYVYTDHRALVNVLRSRTEAKGRLERWRIVLSEYPSIIFKHIEGKKHGAADLLSRPPESVMNKFKEYIETAISYDDKEGDGLPLCGALEFMTCPIMHENTTILKEVAENTTSPIAHMYLEADNPRILNEQATDDECIRIVQYMDSSVFRQQDLEHMADNELKIFAKRCFIYDGLLLAPSETAVEIYVPVIPYSMRADMVRRAHADKMGHLRGDRLIQLITLRGTWPNIKKDIKNFLEQCEVCAKYKRALNYNPAPGKFMAESTFEQITIDVIDLGLTISGYKKCLVAVDTMSRFAWAIAMKNEETESQIDALNRTVIHACIPKVIVCDKHPVYTSQGFRNWAADLGISLHISAGYSTTHVSLVNRLHRTIREMLNKVSKDCPDWTKALSCCLAMYNDTVHPATGFAPREIIYGKKPWTRVDYDIAVRLKPTAGDKETSFAETVVYRNFCIAAAREKFQEAHERMIQSFLDSRSSKKLLQPKEGDRVYRKSPHDTVKEGKRTAVRCFGPYIVTKVEDDGVHCLIKKELFPDSQEERVLTSWLMPARDKVLVHIYPKTDLLDVRNEAKVDEKDSPLFTDSYFRSNPEHGYNTRFKPKKK